MEIMAPIGVRRHILMTNLPLQITVKQMYTYTFKQQCHYENISYQKNHFNTKGVYIDVALKINEKPTYPDLLRTPI